MSVSPNDLLSQAKALLATASIELEFRNIIGRAYYAAFHAAKVFHDALPSPGKQPSRPVGVHQELAHRLIWPTLSEKDSRHTKCRDMGRQLLWLHDKRVKADYRIAETIDKADAVEVLARAEAVLNLTK